MSILTIREIERQTLEEGIMNLDAELQAMTADRNAWKAKYDEASVLLATRVESFRLDSAITEANAWKAKVEQYAFRNLQLVEASKAYMNKYGPGHSATDSLAYDNLRGVLDAIAALQEDTPC